MERGGCSRPTSRHLAPESCHSANLQVGFLVCVARLCEFKWLTQAELAI